MPEDGHYIFATSSDDGSRVFINDKMIIDNDGIHGVTDKQGDAELKAGKHKIRIEFFEGNYGREALHVYLTAISVLIFGPTPVAKIPHTLLLIAQGSVDWTC